MKKILFIAATAALALVAGCAKIENHAPNGSTQHAIGFSNYTPRMLTKADADNYVAPTVATLIPDAQFKVWSWLTANGTAFNGTNGTQFFSNWYTVIYKSGGNSNGTANDYTTDGLRYWPTGATPNWLSFYAYYPSNKTTSITSAPSGFGAFSFTAQDAAANQVDFMVSDVAKDYIYGTAAGTNPNIAVNGTVPLTFRHMLTKVVFEFKKTNIDAVVTVTGASLSGIKNTGTLTTAYSSSETGNITHTWGSQAGTQGYTVAVPTSALTTTAASSGAVANDVFLMVPQTIAADTQKLTVTWTVKSGSDATITNTKTIDLYDILTSADAHINWDKNSQVRYTITIGPKPIYFTATVADWDTELNGLYEIN